MPNFVEIARTAAEIWCFNVWGFFKMAAASILDVRNFEFLTVSRVTSDERRHHVNFVEIVRNVAEICEF